MLGLLIGWMTGDVPTPWLDKESGWSIKIRMKIDGCYQWLLNIMMGTTSQFTASLHSNVDSMSSLLNWLIIEETHPPPITIPSQCYTTVIRDSQAKHHRFTATCRQIRLKLTGETIRWKQHDDI